MELINVVHITPSCLCSKPRVTFRLSFLEFAEFTNLKQQFNTNYVKITLCFGLSNDAIGTSGTNIGYAPPSVVRLRVSCLTRDAAA